MAKRYIDTKFWDDPYISDLDPTEKLLFLYFLTNPCVNIAGIYEITIKRIALDTGFDRDMVEKIIKRFTTDKKLIYFNGFICFNNWTKHQVLNDSVTTGIERILRITPKEVILQGATVFGAEWGQSGGSRAYLTILNLTLPNITKPIGKDIVPAKQGTQLFNQSRNWFIDFTKNKINPNYEFSAKEGKNLKYILDKIKRAGNGASEQDLFLAFQFLITKAVEDDWLRERWEVSMVNSQYNKITNPKTKSNDWNYIFS